MKHGPKRSPIVDAVVDMLRRVLGVSRVVANAECGRRCLLVWWIGSKKRTALIPLAIPKGADLGRIIARECDRVRTLCGTIPARAGA